MKKLTDICQRHCYTMEICMLFCPPLNFVKINSLTKIGKTIKSVKILDSFQDGRFVGTGPRGPPRTQTVCKSYQQTTNKL